MISIKHIVALISVVLCIVLSCVPAFADELTDTPMDAEITESTESEDQSESSGTEETTLPDTPATNPTDESETVVSDDVTENTQVNVIIADNGVTGASTEEGSVWMDGGSGESLVEKLFGEYRPYDATGLASVDWAWVADVTLFAILLVSFFKILGGVIKRV